MILLLLCLSVVFLTGLASAADEDTLNDHFCEEMDGEREVRYSSYIYPSGISYVFVDYETEDTEYERARTVAVASTACSRHSSLPRSRASSPRS